MTLAERYAAYQEELCALAVLLTFHDAEEAANALVEEAFAVQHELDALS